MLSFQDIFNPQKVPESLFDFLINALNQTNLRRFVCLLLTNLRTPILGFGHTTSFEARLWTFSIFSMSVFELILTL